VYHLYGFVGYHLDLEFAAGESFLGLSAGDPEALTYSAHENVLTLRPKAASSQMNVTVTTTEHRYYFQYTIAADLKRVGDEVMYAVRFTYPPKPGAPDGLTAAERVERDLSAAQRSPPRNIDYWFCGSPSIKPAAASDDGVHTRLTFASRAELPAVFVRNDDDSESLLNFSMDAGDVVIHRVAPRFILRRGKLTGCIVNKGFAGSGERLESGTITPQVKRERKDPP
jgi:type IV secretion system protein VirB9